MGGGDLNTKKSWHPNTIKNQERVWKAEQIQANENRRIQDLRKEIDEERFKEELSHHGESSGVLPEKSNKKMDWMYKEPNQGLDREQYLLGKAIDKTFEKIAANEQSQESLLKTPKNHVEHECIPFSIRNLSNTNSNFGQVDIARKLLEDPLVAIRKREAESRSQLLQNPVKLKEISMLLKAEQQKIKRKKEKKKAKKQKHDRSELEDKIFEKLKKLGGDEKNVDIKELLSSSTLLDDLKARKSKKKRKKSSKYSSDSDSESDSDSKHKHHKSKREDKSKKSKKKRDSSEDRDKLKERHSSRDAKSTNTHKHEKEENDKYGRDFHNNKYDDGSHNSDYDKRKSYGLVKADGSKIEINYKKDDREKTHNVYKSDQKKWQKPERKKLSEKEMEEKRQKMMADASKRDYQREKNVAYYKARDKKLEQKEKQEQFREDFAEKQLRVAAGHSSVESRIKSNIYNIQRSHQDMDKHFAKR